MSCLSQAIEEDGFAIIPNAVDCETVTRLIRAVEALGRAGAKRRAGVRNLLQAVPEAAEWAGSPAMRRLVAPILGESFFPVRGLLFDKTPDTNWKVAWHQDLAIAVKERKEGEGFTGWSEKEGVVHVLAPASVLERMLTVRLHLDDCGEENGPLRVVAGSHRLGKLDNAAIDERRQQGQEVACIAPAGSALVMRPLLLHASSAATSPAHRRVIHIEFAADPLPGGLEWTHLG
jgi:hypothetical protein